MNRKVGAAAERQRALFKALEHGIIQRDQQHANGTIGEFVTQFLLELEAKVSNGSKRPKTLDAYKHRASGISIVLRTSRQTQSIQDHEAGCNQPRCMGAKTEPHE